MSKYNKEKLYKFLEIYIYESTSITHDNNKMENITGSISNDFGFRSSFNEENGFDTFESLKDIFNLINMEARMYEDITSFILNTHNLICAMLTEKLNNKEIEVDVLDADDISQVVFEFSSVDDITEDTVNITLL